MTRALQVLIVCGCAALVSCDSLRGNGLFHAAPPTAGVSAAALSANGVYRSPECWFVGSLLELWNGRFRSWSYSDVAVEGVKRDYPEVGSYTVDGDRLTLTGEDGTVSTSYFDEVQGHKLVWSERQRTLYRQERRVSWALIYVGEPPVNIASPWRSRGPNIEILYDDDMRARDQREYEQRYSEVPEPARTLLRARTTEPDSGLDTYKSAIAAARAQLDAALPRQLLELMHVPPEKMDQMIKCCGILGDLYAQSQTIESRPPFLNDAGERNRALGALIEAMAVIRNEHVLLDALEVFLRSAELREMELLVPEVGATLLLTVGPGGSGSFSSDLAGRSTAADWAKAMPAIVEAAQHRCRQALAPALEKPGR